ncbi:MAG: hypothetical protein ACOYN6_00390 [Ignavibacteria bacterium]
MKKNLILIEGTLNSSHLETIKKADENEPGIIVMKDVTAGDFNVLLALSQYLLSNFIPFGMILLGKVEIPGIIILLSHNFAVRFAPKEVKISFDAVSYKNSYVATWDSKKFDNYFNKLLDERSSLNPVERKAVSNNSLVLNYNLGYVSGLLDRQLCLSNTDENAILSDGFVEERINDVALYKERFMRKSANL